MTRPDEIAALADKLVFAAENTQGCLYSQRKMLKEAAAALRASATSPGDAVREALAASRPFVAAQADVESGFDHDDDTPCAANVLKQIDAALAPAEKAGDELVLQWRDGAPPKPWCNEWFIAETTFRDRVVLTALPEEYSYDFKTADDTYIKADKIKRWMQFPDSQFIAPATPTPPSADVARQTIEACRLAIEYSMDMGCSDPACVLLQALNKCDAFLIQSAAHGGETEGGEA